MEMHAIQSKQASMSSGCIVGHSDVTLAAGSRTVSVRFLTFGVVAPCCSMCSSSRLFGVALLPLSGARAGRKAFGQS